MANQNLHTLIGDSRVVFLTGKGGVGKTSIAWSLALLAARKHKKAAVVSWSTLGNTNSETLNKDSISHIQLDTLSCFKEYSLKILRFEKIYEAVFENRILKTFLLATPGVSEAVIAGKIWDLAAHSNFDLLLIDLPSTGHALRFFSSPVGVHQLFTVGFIRRDTEKVLELFSSPTTRVDIVTIPEELPFRETQELIENIKQLKHVEIGHLWINQCLPRYPDLSPTGLNSEWSAEVEEFQFQSKSQEEWIDKLHALKFPTHRIERINLKRSGLKSSGLLYPLTEAMEAL